MFGIRYKVLCPKCKKLFEADHGITPYYKIKGKSNGRYCVEWCTHCDHKFYRLELDEATFLARHRRLTIQEAVEERLKMIQFYRNTDEYDGEGVTNLVTDIYNIPEEDICVDLDAVDKQDIECVGCCCY